MDHHVCLNWGNWHGNLGLKRRIFSRTKGNLKISNIDWQFQTKDPKGLYVRHWISGLRCVPDKFAHEPWNWPGREKLRESPDGYFVCGDDSASTAARPVFAPQSRKQLKRSIDSYFTDCAEKVDCARVCKTRSQHKTATERYSNATRLLSVFQKVKTVHLKE